MMDKKKDKEYLDQIWGEMDTVDKSYLLGDFYAKTILSKKLKQAKQLPDTADHKAERIERLNLLLNYLRGE